MLHGDGARNRSVLSLLDLEVTFHATIDESELDIIGNIEKLVECMKQRSSEITINVRGDYHGGNNGLRETEEDKEGQED